MDALRFRNPAIQFSYENVQRELIKAYTSFHATRLPAIATGNWGCGAFNGDRQLKGIGKVDCLIDAHFQHAFSHDTIDGRF